MIGEKTLNISLHPKQLEIFQDTTRFKVAVTGRRFGKSWLAVADAVIKALDERNVQKMPVFIVCPTFPQARTIYWKRLLELAQPVLKSSNVNLGLVELDTGVEIHIKGADRPDSLRGAGLWHVVMDEWKDMKPEVWEIIVSPSLSDATLYGGGTALHVGSPAGRNHFYTMVQDAKTDTTGEWKVWEFTTSDNPYIPRKEIESARLRMSSSAFRQEYEGSFESGGNNVFLREWFKYEPEPKDGEYYMAVDLAGFENMENVANLKKVRLDESAIAIVKAGDYGWWVKDIVHGRWGTKETAEQIVLLAQKYEPRAVGIEKGALKNAVEQYLHEAMFRHKTLFHVHELSHGNKAKTDRIVWALQGRMEHGRITFNEEGQFIKELEDQLINFPSKTVHDDLVDALAYIEQLANNSTFDFGDFETSYADILDPVAGY